MAAGAFMNFVLGFLVLLILICNQDRDRQPQNLQLFRWSHCGHATGLEVGDEILAVNGRRCFVANDIVYELARTENVPGRLYRAQRRRRPLSCRMFSLTPSSRRTATTRMSLGFVVYGHEKNAA